MILVMASGLCSTTPLALRASCSRTRRPGPTEPSRPLCQPRFCRPGSKTAAGHWTTGPPAASSPTLLANYLPQKNRVSWPSLPPSTNNATTKRTECGNPYLSSRFAQNAVCNCQPHCKLQRQNEILMPSFGFSGLL